MDHRVILTPCEETDPSALQKIRAMWQSTGAEVLDMGVAEHDAILAATSHLPHVLAYALVDALASSDASEPILEWIELAALAIEVLAVVIIVVAVACATLHYLYLMVKRQRTGDIYRQYKTRLGKALMLGLEILVAADIVRTVALETTLESVVGLGLLVLIRTFLSWSLSVEIEGHWPWQANREKE